MELYIVVILVFNIVQYIEILVFQTKRLVYYTMKLATLLYIVVILVFRTVHMKFFSNLRILYIMFPNSFIIQLLINNLIVFACSFRLYIVNEYATLIKRHMYIIDVLFYIMCGDVKDCASLVTYII